MPSRCLIHWNTRRVNSGGDAFQFVPVRQGYGKFAQPHGAGRKRRTHRHYPTCSRRCDDGIHRRKKTKRNRHSERLNRTRGHRDRNAR